ncbi:MAG TPA: hypothetical protein VFY63_16970 [Pseudorhizobium sp.]|nr:hypothetical protein [Pseudorhizobium sp.]
MHKSNKKALPALTREVFAAKLSGAMTKDALYAAGFDDEIIKATATGVEALTQAIEDGVFNAYLSGARTEEHYRSQGFTKEELSLVSDRVARRVRDAEQVAA